MKIEINRNQAVYRFEKKDTDKFKIWLLKHNFTLKEFCRKYAIDQSSLSTIINGKRCMSLKVMRYLKQCGYRFDEN